MEDEVEDVKETSLSKEQKKKLRRAEADHEKNLEVLAVGVSEVFSPPRISKEAERQHMRVGKAYDLKTGYDLKEEKDRRRMWKELHQDDPELVTGSPPCTPFSILQKFEFAEDGESQSSSYGRRRASTRFHYSSGFASGNTVEESSSCSNIPEDPELLKRRKF